MPFVPPGLGLDVDAVMNDRAMSTCGVSDVLSANPTWDGSQRSHAFLPSFFNSHPHSDANSIIVSPSLSDSMTQHLGRGRMLLHSLTYTVS